MSIVGKTSQQYFGFDPRTIPGCLLWLDAADSSTLTGTSPVTQWNDKSGNGRNATTGSGSVTRIGSSINSLPALRFGNGISLNVNSFSVSNAQTTAFFVLRGITAATSGNYGYFVFGRAAENYGGAGNQSFFTYYFISPQFFYAAVAGSGGERDYGGASATNPFLSTNSVVSLLGNSAGFVNGTNQPITTAYNNGNPSNSSLSTPATYQIGTSDRPDAFTFDLGELIVYDGILTTAQRQQVEGYLAWKWGLQTSVPVSHPYRSIYPIMRLFQPIDIGIPEFWYDSADLSTITSSGTTLISIANKGSVIGNNMTPSVGTHTTGIATQNTTNLVRLPTNGRLVFTGSFPVAARSRFIAARQTTSTGVIFLYQNFTSFNGHDAFGFDDGRVFYEVAQGQILTLLTGAAPVQTNLFGVYTFLNAATAAGNRIAITGSNLALTNSEGAQQYFSGSANNFVGGTGSYDLGEWISYNTTLTIPQAQQIEGYLAWKWGVQSNLPTTHPYYRVLPSTPLFVPSQLSGLQLWLDAADTSTISTSGTNVTQWRDKSGNNNHTTATSGTITYTTNTPPRVSLSNSFLTGPFSTTFTGSNMECFAVASLNTSSGAYGRILSLGRPGVNDFNQTDTTFPFIRNGGLNLMIGRSNTYRDISLPAYDTLFLARAGHSGTGTEFIGINGGTEATANTVSGNFNITSYGVGTNTNTGDVNYWAGDICEIIVYFGVTFTPLQRQQVEGYLAWKWGLQNNLPPVASTQITPSSISGLVVWNDASILTEANGTALTTWSNAGSGGTVNCTGTVVTGGLNGLRVVRFTPSQTWSTVTDINLAAHSFFFVSRQRGGTNGRVWNGTANNHLYGYWGGYKRSFYVDNNPNHLATAVSDTTWDLFSLTRSASGPYIFKWQGNAQFSGSSSSSANMTGLAINGGAFYEPSDCEIAEVILYNSVLTPSQVAGVEAYLSAKWGVGGTASTGSHPFKKFRA